MDTNENKFDSLRTTSGKRFKSLVDLNKKGFTVDHQLDRIKELTQKMIHTYELGLKELQALPPEVQKKADEYLNEVRVYSNQLNHMFAVEKMNFEEGTEIKHAELSKRLDDKISDLEASALKFENLGVHALVDDQKENWENNYTVYLNEISPELLTNSDAAKLVLQFKQRYNSQELKRLSTIIERNFPNDQIVNEEQEYETRYLKALKEFKDEFREDKNLWDTVLDILAGGVHPSPNERVMLQKWVDGEQKLDGEGDF